MGTVDWQEANVSPVADLGYLRRAASLKYRFEIQSCQNIDHTRSIICPLIG